MHMQVLLFMHSLANFVNFSKVFYKNNQNLITYNIFIILIKHNNIFLNSFTKL